MQVPHRLFNRQCGAFMTKNCMFLSNGYNRVIRIVLAIAVIVLYLTDNITGNATGHSIISNY
jgi:hypothetical protein